MTEAEVQEPLLKHWSEARKDREAAMVLAVCRAIERRLGLEGMPVPVVEGRDRVGSYVAPELRYGKGA